MNSVRRVSITSTSTAASSRAPRHAATTSKPKPLDVKQSANYRWLLIQPFLAMDNYATAMLTPQQEQTLTHLAEELPMLLAYVDGKDYAHSPKSETEKLSSVLSEYFLKCYLKSVL